MHALQNSKHLRSRDEAAVDGLVVAGLTELALGALTGWPMAIAVSRPEDLASSASAPARGCASGIWT
jgi:hypothetical protein